MVDKTQWPDGIRSAVRSPSLIRTVEVTTSPIRRSRRRTKVQQQALNDCIDKAYREFRNALNANGLNLSGKLYSGFNAARPHLDDLIPLSLGALAGYFAKEAFGPITAGISSLYAPGEAAQLRNGGTTQ